MDEVKNGYPRTTRAIREGKGARAAEAAVVVAVLAGALFLLALLVLGAAWAIRLFVCDLPGLLG